MNKSPFQEHSAIGTNTVSKNSCEIVEGSNLTTASIPILDSVIKMLSTWASSCPISSHSVSIFGEIT